MLRFQPMITSRMRRFIACLGGVRAKSINNRKKIPVCGRPKTNFYEINIPILSKTQILYKKNLSETLSTSYCPTYAYLYWSILYRAAGLSLSWCSRVAALVCLISAAGGVALCCLGDLLRGGSSITGSGSSSDIASSRKSTTARLLGVPSKREIVCYMKILLNSAKQSNQPVDTALIFQCKLSQYKPPQKLQAISMVPQ